MKAFCIWPGDGDSYIAQDVVLVEREQMAQELFKYEAAQVRLSVNGQRMPSIKLTARSVNQFKA